MMKQLLAIAFAIFTCACSVNYGFSGADIPAEANSFSVQYFGNSTALASTQYRQQITEGLKDFLLAQTPLSLSTKNGDLQFSGKVTAYNVRPVAVQTGDVGALQRLSITLQVSYVNTFDASKNFEKSFTRFADFETSQDFNSVEDQLIDEINEQLIQDIFNASVGSW